MADQAERQGRLRSRGWSWEQLQRSIMAFWDCSEANRRLPMRRVICYVIRLVEAYNTHQCGLMACACAFCAVLSLIPLLVIGIAALGFFMGGSVHALDSVIHAIRYYVPINPLFLRELLSHILKDRRVIGAFGLIGLIYGAHQTFLALQPAMNLVWVVAETRHWLRQRAIALGATLLTLVLLGADLAASTAIALVFQQNLPLSDAVSSLLLRMGLGAIPLLLTTTLFAMLYRLLPARTVPLKPALVGAGVAALLWQATKIGFGFFLVYSHGYDRLYGSLSSLVILVVWTYYSMAILLLGAEIAADYEFMRHGERAAIARSHSGADLAAAHGGAEPRSVQMPPIAGGKIDDDKIADGKNDSSKNDSSKNDSSKNDEGKIADVKIDDGKIDDGKIDDGKGEKPERPADTY